MTFDAAWFRAAHVAAGGTRNAANSYVSYLNRADRMTGGIEEEVAASGGAGLVARLERLPDAAFGGTRNRRDSMAALRRYVRLRGSAPVAQDTPPPVPVDTTAPTEPSPDEVDALLVEAGALGARYYRVMGRPLGIMGEVAELSAARLLGVRLAKAREVGFDGLLERGGVDRRVQIKGRAVDRANPYRGRCPSIRLGGLFDIALLVLIDRDTMDVIEIWEATAADIALKLGRPGSVARNERGSLGIAQFKGAGMSGARQAVRVWPSR